MRMVAEGAKRVPLSLHLAGDVAAEMPISAMLVALARGQVSAFEVVPALMRPGPKAGPEGRYDRAVDAVAHIATRRTPPLSAHMA